VTSLSYVKMETLIPCKIGTLENIDKYSLLRLITSTNGTFVPKSVTIRSWDRPTPGKTGEKGDK